MSSTNRSNARMAHVSDYYRTPEPTIQSFLSAVNNDDYEFLEGWLTSGDDVEKLDILDPCAGGDANHTMAYPMAIGAHSGWKIGRLDTVDIRPDSPALYHGDYLSWSAPQQYHVIISNPPFN